MKISAKSKLDFSAAERLVEGDEFWETAAHEWHRIYSDYVPHDTGQLRDRVEYAPGEIRHIVPYARYIYNGIVMVDPEYGCGGFTADGGISWFSRKGVKKKYSGREMHMKNGSRLWDEAAKKDKKDLILVKTMQNWINRNL